MRVTVLAACLTSACTTASLQAEQQALLIAPGAATRNELHAAVSTALGNPQLTLASDALTRDPVLIVERVARRDASGALLDGRELGLPERFVLLVQDARCMLVHERTGQRWPLRHAQCRPAASAAP